MASEQFFLFGSFSLEESKYYQSLPPIISPGPQFRFVPKFVGLETQQLQESAAAISTFPANHVTPLGQSPRLNFQGNTTAKSAATGTNEVPEPNVESSLQLSVDIKESDTATDSKKPTSWVSVVGSPSNQTTESLHSAADEKPSVSDREGQLGTEADLLAGDNWLESLRELHSSGKIFYVPRGLQNVGNTCFLNSTLQILLGCWPFLHLMSIVSKSALQLSDYPTLKAFTEFLQEFKPVASANKKEPGTTSAWAKPSAFIEIGKPLAPSMFEPVLESFSPQKQSVKRRQEDAQEFLSHVLDCLHEELLRAQSQNRKEEEDVAGKSGDLDPTEDEWETVGPKNRTAVTRTHSQAESGLSQVFGGQVKSVVRAKGSKDSATVQPFMLLHLDIASDQVNSLESALVHFVAQERLHGYKGKEGQGEVNAVKALSLLSLPRILILHFMRFSFGSTGSAKLHKGVTFPQKLVLPREALAMAAPSPELRTYTLAATVSHHGKDLSGGHYTADVKHSGGIWLRFDDSQVNPIPAVKALHDQAYLLVYERASM